MKERLEACCMECWLIDPEIGPVKLVEGVCPKCEKDYSIDPHYRGLWRVLTEQAVGSEQDQAQVRVSVERTGTGTTQYSTDPYYPEGKWNHE